MPTNTVAPLIQPYDFSTVKVTMKSANPLRPMVKYITGLQGISEIDGVTTDSVIVRGTGNVVYGHTPGVVTWNDVTFDVLKSEWEQIKALFGLYELVHGITLIDFNIVGKMPGIAVKTVTVTNLIGCKFVGATSSASQGADALTASLTFRPLAVTDGNPISAIANAIRSNL